MGQRRMFSLIVINSARFLKLPIDAQNLYFHLGLRADDDGIVEAFPVMRLLGSSEDNLKLLHAKEFVKVLNEDLVTYITDWKEHNLIRADRKIDSIYKDLIIKILPDVKLLESKERADRKKGQPMDVHGTSQGQPMDRISKVKLSKVKKSKINKVNYSDNVSLAEDEHLKLINEYGEFATSKMIEILDNYKGQSGKTYQSDYKAILNWVVMEYQKRFNNGVYKQNKSKHDDIAL